MTLLKPSPEIEKAQARIARISGGDGVVKPTSEEELPS